MGWSSLRALGPEPFDQLGPEHAQAISWILKRRRNLRCTYVRVGAKRRLYIEEFMLFTVVLEKTLESPLDCEEIKPVNPEGNQP